MAGAGALTLCGDDPIADGAWHPLEVTPNDTMLLCSFDEGEGIVARNLASPGESDGELRVGGDPPGPVWSDEVR